MTPPPPPAASFLPFALRMQAAGLAPVVIHTFEYYYTQLVQGSAGLIPECEITAPDGLPDAETLQDFQPAGRAALARAVVIKLNGGLGTSMGLAKAKSLLPARDNLSFLDVIARQVLTLRKRTGAPVPLLLMNSFSTHDDTLAALQSYPKLDAGIPMAFVQHRIPKILQETLAPAESPTDPEMEWCPPGHGDLYLALETGGILDVLLARGFEYAFVSNSDNLGAVLEETILGYFARRQLPFLMEVADRTSADSKGGHLARRPDGRLALREVAQCPPDALTFFGDITLYRYFNTNNIWLNLRALRSALDENEGVLRLPLIRNSKNLDPRDPESPKVYQLETAMGAAIELFANAGAIRVPRRRFAPVKLCSDLLVLWSDAYQLTDDYRVTQNPGNTFGLPIVQLDPDYYRFVDDLRARFPSGAPSLTGCQRLTIKGDIRFGRDIAVRGSVTLTNPGKTQAVIADGTLLDRDTEFS